MMKFQVMRSVALGAAMTLAGITAGNAQMEQFIPVTTYDTGPYAVNGQPFMDGFVDYMKMLNARDGGINGVKLIWEECETGYKPDRFVECYERLKNKGPTGAAAFNPLGTGLTYAVIDPAPAPRLGRRSPLPPVHRASRCINGLPGFAALILGIDPL